MASQYDLMQAIKRCGAGDYSRTTELAKMMKDHAIELMRLVLFVETNITILNHLLVVIDKHTLAFENPNFHKFFKIHYDQTNSILKRLIEHPGLLRAYFQMKNSTRKLLGKIDKKYNHLLILDQVHELLPIVVNNFETIEDHPIKKRPSFIQTEINEEPPHNETIAIEYLNTIKSLLSLQTNFFNQTIDNVFNKFGIEITKYCNVPELEAIAEKHYNHEMLTKDDFIDLELELRNDKKNDINKKPCYSMVDLYLVLIHTFLFFTAYYGLALTSYLYSEDLGINKSLSGILQAVTPLAAVMFSFVLNYITLNNRYRYPYFISLTLLFSGMLLYYLAHTFNENKSEGLIILVIGRVLFGMGGARIMTRKFIAINVDVGSQSKYSSILVSISAFGICFGPGLSAVLQFANDTDMGATDLFDANILAFVFIFVFAILFILFIIFFKGYNKLSDYNLRRIEFSDSILELKHSQAYTTSNRNLLERRDFYGHPDFKISTFERQPVNSNLSASNLKAFQGLKTKQVPFLQVFFPNKATIVISIIFLIIKIIQEAFFTELPQLSTEYYQHSSQWVGWFLVLSTFYGKLISNTNSIIWCIYRQENAR